MATSMSALRIAVLIIGLRKRSRRMRTFHIGLVRELNMKHRRIIFQRAHM
jgi:hypothetical protein